MFTVTVEGHFSSAHNLIGYKGKCEELHGHNWKVAASAKVAELNKEGMVVDFHEFKDKLHKVLEELDHTYINKLSYFSKVNPTSERIAEYIFQRLKKLMPQLCSVTVWENHGSSACYEE
jgi:6-pyruvoyltetrahydropterin/6-carboxytetrahydropterin synthase